jgi:hypothetical protein
MIGKPIEGKLQYYSETAGYVANVWWTEFNGIMFAASKK